MTPSTRRALRRLELIRNAERNRRAVRLSAEVQAARLRTLDAERQRKNQEYA